MATKAPPGKAVPEALEKHTEGVEPSSATPHDPHEAHSTKAERSKTGANPKVPGKSVPDAIDGSGEKS